MKFNFKKICAIEASAILTGTTMGIADAANYPAPFVSGSTANVAIVYGTGTGVNSLDLVQAGNIQSNLQSKMTSTTTSTTTSDEAKSLNSGSNYLYLLDNLNENVGTITKLDLPTVLADGKFTDDAGTNYEYEQTITVGSSTANRFSFGNSDNEYDNPELMLELATSTATPMYTWTVVFDKATPLNATDSEGQEITFFGKTYTIGTASDGDTLILLGGSGAETINVGETVPIVVNGVTYQVSVTPISSADVASITVNGVTKTMTEGQTKVFTVDGVELDVYAKTVFRTGDSGEGYVAVELGADKITLEDGAVKIGADETEIDGTLVALTGDSATVAMSLTKLTIAVAAEDSDVNDIAVGKSFVDPVFKTVKLDFNSVTNGPTIDPTSGEDSGRTLLALESGGNRELEVKFTDSSGTTKTIPFTYQGQMRDDSSNPFMTIEGNNLTDDDMFILNSGDYQHVMKVSKVNIVAATPADSDVEIEDVFTGLKYLVENKDFTTGQNVTINSQTYVITNNTAGVDASGLKIESADAYAKTHRDLFPSVQLVSGEDFPRFALINVTNVINDGAGDNIVAVSNDTPVAGRIYRLPTGTIQFQFTDGNVETVSISDATVVGYRTSTDDADPTGAYTNLTGVTTGTTAEISTNFSTIAVGKAYYTFALVSAQGDNGWLNITNVSLDDTFTASTVDATSLDSLLTKPALLFVEDKDKSDSDNRHVVLLNTTDSSTYSQLNTVLFSGTTAVNYDTETFDNTDLIGYLTNFGTYILQDGSDDNIKLASLTYGSAQMYANVFFAEAGATITPGTGGGGQLGNVLVKDSEVSNVATKNLIVVGGSCINSAAAKLLGSSVPICTAAWTQATGVGSGQFLIKGYATSTITSKLALLVAGYEAADTANAATYLTTKTVDTSTGGIGTTSTAALTAFA